jgi:hypothetical protein
MDEWNKTDLYMDDPLKRNEIIVSKLLELKNQKKTVVIKQLDNTSRKYIHTIAREYGIDTNSINKIGSVKKNIADLIISSEKELSPLPRYAQPPLQPKQIYKKREWTGSCRMCDTELDSYNALYNIFIGGPFCEDCTENDDELSGHKWEDIY